MTQRDLFKCIRTSKNVYLLSFFCLLMFTWPVSPLFAGDTVAVFYNQSNSTYQFAATEMKKAMETSGYSVYLEDIKNLTNDTAQNRIIITVRGTAEAKKFLSLPGISSLPSASKEGYCIRTKTDTTGTAWYIIGADKSGALYGSLEVSRQIKINGIQSLRELDKKPFIANRGIKFNIPLDARTPGYSDNGDAAQKNIADMWDTTFWHQLLDGMARNRFNMLSLWSLAPFPSLVNVPEYPKAGINDVKKTTWPLKGFKTLTGTNMANSNVLANLITVKTITLSEKIKFWQQVMQYASERGIDCYLFTWNIFTFGTENSGYNFTTALTDFKTKDYIRKATRSLIKTYPLLKGIGITAGENLNGSEAENENFLFDTYGKGINDALKTDSGRTFQLIHRAHQANIKTIKTAFSGLHSRCSLAFSYKYSQAHVYSSSAPDYIYKAKFLDKIGNSDFFLTLRDDDWYYLRGGSDPGFTRTYLKNIPATNFSGFYLGSDGYTWGREYVSINSDSSNQLVYNKRWYSFLLWGELAYDPDLPDSLFTGILNIRFPNSNAQNLQDAWAKASQVIPLVNRFHNEGCTSDYQWYPEACFSNGGFHDVNRFISAGPQSNEGLIGISAYTHAVLKNIVIAGTTPLQVARNLQTVSDQALSLISGITGSDKELNQTISDITAMAYLGRYYAKKILGATNKNIADNTADSSLKQLYKSYAITNLRDAAECWRNYASQISYAYVPQWLTRMQQLVDIKDIQSEVDNDILLAGGTINRVPVSGVTISAATMNICANDTIQLTTLVKPLNATNKAIRWSSGDNSIATVEAGGLVKGGASGSVIITATSLDGNKTDSIVITVTDSCNIMYAGSSWVTGTSHAKAAGVNRALIVFIYGEDSSLMSVTSARYGGKNMMPVIEINMGSTVYSYTGAFILNEAGIAAAKDGNIGITWDEAPRNGSAIISVFFSNVNQSTLVGDTASGGGVNAATVTTNAVSNTPGDVVLLAATAGRYSADYALNNGFIKGPSEQNPSWGDIVAGYKMATGISEAPCATMPDSMRQSIIGFVLKAERGITSALRKNAEKVNKPGTVQVYPNPVTHKNLTVDFHQSFKSGLIQLFDVSGKLVLKRIINNEAKVNLNMRHLAKGMYLLNIYGIENSPVKKKILIQ